MPQSPIPVFTYNGGGGLLPKYNQTAASVIKASPGRVARVIVEVVGTAGNLIINDCITTGAAAIANQVASIPFGSLAVGVPVLLDWPCTTGIVVSAVPTGMTFSISYQ